MLKLKKSKEILNSNFRIKTAMEYLKRLKLLGIILYLACFVFSACKTNAKSQKEGDVKCINLIKKLGDKAPTKLADCMKLREKLTVLEVRDFLNEKGYEVETDGELNSSVKKGIVEFSKDNGLGMHTVQHDANTVFEINELAINEQFCSCVKDELKIAKRNQ